MLKKNTAQSQTRSGFHRNPFSSSMSSVNRLGPQKQLEGMRSRSQSPSAHELSVRETDRAYQTQSRFEFTEESKMNMKSDYNFHNPGLGIPGSSQGFKRDGMLKDKQHTDQAREKTASLYKARDLVSSQNSIEPTDYVQTLIKRKTTKKQKSLMAVDQISKLFMSRNGG